MPYVLAAVLAGAVFFLLSRAAGDPHLGPFFVAVRPPNTDLWQPMGSFESEELARTFARTLVNPLFPVDVRILDANGLDVSAGIAG